MRKTISTILMFLLAATPVLGATTLWNYFVDEQGIKMPTVEERTPMAERCGISHYRGTYEQNIEFLECLQRERSETISEPIGGPMFGSTYPVASGWHYLAGSGIGTSDTSITLRSLKTRDGREITMSNFGTIGYATIEPGSLDKFEIISFTGISQDPNSDEATLTGVSRGIDVLYPYNASSSLAKSHSGGSYLIFSDPPSLYAFYANRNNDESIWGDWTYSATNTPQYNVEPTLTNDLEFAYKGYVDSVATSGAPDALENTKGLVELATREELNSSSATGTSGAYLVAQVQHFSTSSSATTVVPVTGSDGKLDQGFIDLTEDFTFSGNVTTTGKFYATGTVTIATSTITASQIDTLTHSSTTDATDFHYHSNQCVSGVNSTTSGTGIQTITHKLKVKPTLIEIWATGKGWKYGSKTFISWSHGIMTGSDTSTQSCIYQGIEQEDVTKNLYGTTTNSVVHFVGNDSPEETSVDASIWDYTTTTFDLNWTTNTTSSKKWIQWKVCK